MSIHLIIYLFVCVCSFVKSFTFFCHSLLFIVPLFSLTLQAYSFFYSFIYTCLLHSLFALLIPFFFNIIIDILCLLSASLLLLLLLHVYFAILPLHYSIVSPIFPFCPQHYHWYLYAFICLYCSYSNTAI